MLVRGIDYYLVENSSVPLGDSRKVYLGRSASGWCFFLHVYPNRNILDWKNLLKYVRVKVSEGWVIKSTNEMTLSVEAFENIVSHRQKGHISHSNQWYLANRAIRGPRGLARKIKDNYVCLGHGNSTFDYVSDEFFHDLPPGDQFGLLRNHYL
jgi:hypothetical protein